MQAFEEGPLRRHAPCNFSAPNRVIEALAEVHVEFILIHPFREGNGRVGRILSTPDGPTGEPAAFGLSPDPRPGQKKTTLRRCAPALDRNYKPMEEIFELVLNRTASGA